MKKRGVIELQFNWIFILIAGAIIFVFFISIVNKQKEFSDLKASGTIITNLDAILTGAQVSTDTVNIVDMPKVDVGFECNRYFIGHVPKQIKGNVIFAPNLLKGKQLITWALDWNMPYRVTNFLYLTDPQLRYIIVNNSQNLGMNIFDELPKEINKELIDESELSNITNKNNYKVKFIFLGNTNLNNSLKNLKKMPDEDVTAINLTDIGTLNMIPNTGTIKFLKKEGDKWKEEESDGKKETYYLKKESLFGAIFVADLEMYNCVMKKAFKKLNLVTKVYLNRSSTLADYYGINNILCGYAHSDAVTNIEHMKFASEERITDFPNTLQNMEAMNDYNNNIKSKNQNAQLSSCALIY